MPDPDLPIYPLRFQTLLKTKVWGGHNIARLFPDTLASDERIGETWLVWDELPVANGPLRGTRLADVVRDRPEAILGRRVTADGGARFPLLVKFVDAQDVLSVQVHPDDSYARRVEHEPVGKSEAWYVVHAEPGCELIYGLAQPMSSDELRAAIASGKVRDLLGCVPVAAGDCIVNHTGTIHALAPGVVVYEVQQSSDLTYRLYDWDRNNPERPLHVEKSLDVANLAPPAQAQTRPVELEEPGATRAILCATQYYAAERLTLHSAARHVERPGGDCFHILTALHGTSHLRDLSVPGVEYDLLPGDSILVPAAIDRYELWTGEPGATVIKAYVPDLARDIAGPLLARGIPWDDIVQLGGDPAHSDLAGLREGSD
jgi:mannose-6-phosphate isomerase